MVENEKTCKNHLHQSDHLWLRNRAGAVPGSLMGITMMEFEARKKGRVGSFEVWLVGKMAWEVRVAGTVVATARNCSDCWRSAERLHAQSKSDAAS